MELFSKSMLLRSALLLEKLLHPRPPIIRLSLSCSSSSKATGVRKTRQRMTSKRTQPAWEAPNPGEIPKLKLFNSLTREKEVFVPQQGKKVEDNFFWPTNLHSLLLVGHLVQLWPHSLWCFTHGSCKKLSLFWHSPESSSGGKQIWSETLSLFRQMVVFLFNLDTCRTILVTTSFLWWTSLTSTIRSSRGSKNNHRGKPNLLNITRARQNHLYQQYLAGTPSLDKVG